MNLIRRFIGLFVALFLIFGMIGCQEDPVGSDSNQKEHVTEAAKLATSDKDLKVNPAEKEKDKNQEKKKNKKEENQDHEDASSETTSKSSSSDSGKSSKKKQKRDKKTRSQNNDNRGTSSTSSSTKSKNGNQTKKQKEPAETVTVSVVGDKEKGTIVKAAKVSIDEDASFLDATLKALREQEIQYSVRGSGATAYVEGIANLYEFDRGPMSGWTAKKNGKTLSKSAGITPVDDGDVIEWIYTTDYTKD